jgi:hypothetical protein
MLGYNPICGPHRALQSYDIGTRRSYRYTSCTRKGEISSLASTDSDLEAFSHNPADGSFAALPVQATA